MSALRVITLCVTLFTCMTICTGVASSTKHHYGMKEYTIVLDKKKTPTEASSLCKSEHGASLATILDTATVGKLNEWLYVLSEDIDSNVHELWLGDKSNLANDAYMDLVTNQPLVTGSRCVVLSNKTLTGQSGYHLYSKDCSGAKHYVCEKTDFVTSSAVLGEFPAFEPLAERFDDHDHDSIITAVTVYEYNDGTYQYISCVEFVYGQNTATCSGDHASSETKHILQMQPGEFITEVEGEASYVLKKIGFKTNWGNSIQPVGVSTGLGGFKVSNNGAPLMYVSGTRGMWLYQIQFHFFSYKVNQLKSLTEIIANKVYQANKNGEITQLVELNTKYQSMLPDVCSQGCALYTTRRDSNYVEFEDACLLMSLLEQLNIYTTSRRNLQKHLPRNLMKIADYNSVMLLKAEKDARDFHNVLTQLTFTITQVGQQVQGTVVSVTQSMADNLNNYFSTVATFDKKIAEADRAFVAGKLGTLTTESNKLMGELDIRIKIMLGIAVATTAADVVEAAIKLAAAAAKSFNPLGWLFGGNDANDIADRVQDLTLAIRNAAHAARLMSTLHIYSKYLKELAGKFKENDRQLAVMRTIIAKFSAASAEEQASLASTYIQSYNDYSPQVSAHEVVYASELLSAVVGEGCDLISGTSGSIANALNAAKHLIEIPVTLGRQEPSSICTELQPLLAKLHTMYESVFNFQFEMTEIFTRIARANIAEKMAGKISDIKTVQQISVVTAATGSLMVEIRTQAVAHARCSELEYKESGSRPQICRNMHFTDNLLTQIISYKGSIQQSTTQQFAFIPMTPPLGKVTNPYIDVEKLIANGETYFQLPIKDKTWMMKYKWLPSTYTSSNYNKETGFFIESFEMFLPGLKCTGLTDYDVQIDVTSGTNVNLYSEPAPPSFIIPEVKYSFVYKKTTTCGSGNTIDFDVRKNDTAMTKLASQNVCIPSQGNTVIALQPSLYSTWLVKLLTPVGCNAKLEQPTGYSPLATVRIKRNDILAGDMQECWPTNSRCSVGKRCVDGVLSFTCQ